MCGDEVMCQIGDTALVVEPTSVRHSSAESMGGNPTSAHPCRCAVSSLTYTSVAESGRMSDYQVVAITGRTQVTRAEWANQALRQRGSRQAASLPDDAALRSHAGVLTHKVARTASGR